MTVRELIDKLNQLDNEHSSNLTVYAGYECDNPLCDRNEITDIFTIESSDIEENNCCCIRLR